MTLDFACGSCGQKYRVDVDLAGKKVQCKSCSELLTVPSPNASRTATPSRPTLQSFGDKPPGARPPLQSFGGGATPPASGRKPTPPPADLYDDSALDDFDESPATDPYADDEVYAAPKAGYDDVDDFPRPGRPGSVKARRDMVFASFWARFAAIFLDGFIVLGILILVVIAAAIIAGLVFGPPAQGVADENNPFVMTIMAGYFLGLLVAMMYPVFMISSSKQATLGKMAVGIKVVDKNGHRLSFGRALGREASKFFITGLIPFAIGYIMAAFTEKKQALHDMIASTLVVKK